jgi:hypothetical protein
MILGVTPKYKPKTEKEFCCVPAVLQMIQERRGLEYGSQDEIGYQLGLIVPKEKAHLYPKALTGRMPKHGWGTQVSKRPYSINEYFKKNGYPLELTIHSAPKVEAAIKFIIQNIKKNNDIIVCYNSLLLFGSGDEEHVSLIEEIDPKNGEMTIIDPAIGVPKTRKVEMRELLPALKFRRTGGMGGLWVVSGKC